MDLRQFHSIPSQTDEAARRLRYQPFVLDDNRHTGVAYTWLYTPDPTKASDSDFLFDRRTTPEDVWSKAYEANRRLAALYDGFVNRIVEMCPKGSYLDFACNNGYFPVRASLAGVQTAVGIDQGDFSAAFKILNEITGASAKFLLGGYDSSSHTIRVENKAGAEKYDVVSISAVLCHLPDPLHFLKAVAGLASKAVFIWNGFFESDELLVRYQPVNKFYRAEFPNGFDDATSISIPLLHLSMDQLGFPHYEELQAAPDSMPESWLRPAGLRAFLFWR